MKLQELQKWVHEDWQTSSHEKPSRELQILFMVEEMGEVAEAIRKKDGRKKRVSPNKDFIDVGSEMGDLLIALVTLANTYDVNLAEEVTRFQARLKERQKVGY